MKSNLQNFRSSKPFEIPTFISLIWGFYSSFSPWHAPIPHSLSPSKSLLFKLFVIIFIENVYCVQSTNVAKPNTIRRGAIDPQIGLIALRVVGLLASPSRVQAFPSSLKSKSNSLATKILTCGNVTKSTPTNFTSFSLLNF